MVTQKTKRAAFAEASANPNTNLTNWQTNYSKQVTASKAYESRQRHLIYSTLLNFLKIRNLRRNDKYLEIIHDVPKRLWQALKGTNDQDLVFRSAPLPTKLENGIICQTLLKYFAQNALLSVDGFVLLRDYDEDGKIIESVRLDVFPYPHGFIVPIYQGTFIKGLLVSRHPDDKKPFTLRTRQKLLHLNSMEVEPND